MERFIPMSTEEIKRTAVFSKLQAKMLTQQQAADEKIVEMHNIKYRLGLFAAR